MKLVTSIITASASIPERAVGLDFPGKSGGLF
jgi:hypothetical protein